MTEISRSGCKLNWYLKVTGKRSDGYHDIATLFQYLPEPSDEIEFDFNAAPGIKVSCSDKELPQDLDNLAGKAAQAYSAAAEITPSWNIFIRKHIPSAAGLGGGSADAGTVLRMLEKHYQALGREKLISIAAKIGADVPFFLDPGLVLAEGIGEKMTALPMPESLPPLLLVFPGFPVSAKWAYCNLAPERITPSAISENLDKFLEALNRADSAALAGFLHNDLEYALFEKFPLLGVLREELCRCGAQRVMVSGSGSTIFALFPDTPSRSMAADSMKNLLETDPSVRIFEVGGEL